MLGGFELRRAGRVVAATPAAQRLLAYVATRTRASDRAATAAVLWPDLPDARAAANLLGRPADARDRPAPAG